MRSRDFSLDLYEKDAQTHEQTGFDNQNFVNMGQNKDLKVDLALSNLLKFVDWSISALTQLMVWI